MHRFVVGWTLAIVLAALSEPAAAQVCRPVSERARVGDAGCWIIANAPMGRLGSPHMFWHLDTFPTRAAAEAVKGPRGTIVEAYEKVWLLTIDAQAWRPPAGDRVAAIGPLPIHADGQYSVQYMEATFNPGMTAPSHEHPGPEAWHTIAGETCLETPDGKFVGRAGGAPVIVPGGPPMHLTATGKEQRRALVLILHDASKAPTKPRHDWTPKGLCKD